MSQLAIGLEQLRPTVSLTSSAGWKNTYLPDPDKLLFNYSGGVVISYPFYDGGRAKARRVEEIEKQKSLDLEIERIVSQTQTAERVVRAELEKISAKARITSEKLALARRALEIAQVSYNTGMITNTDYLDTELEVQEIETEALADLHALLLARLELKRVLSHWPELDR
jgi:outer membrane protein TolC